MREDGNENDNETVKDSAARSSVMHGSHTSTNLRYF